LLLDDRRLAASEQYVYAPAVHGCWKQLVKTGGPANCLGTSPETQQSVDGKKLALLNQYAVGKISLVVTRQRQRRTRILSERRVCARKQRELFPRFRCGSLG
jgi:hypothetical protein